MRDSKKNGRKKDLLSREELAEKVRAQEREAVEKAMDVALKAYGPAFRELEKY